MSEILENIKKFISELGFTTYATAHEERTRREIDAKFVEAMQTHVNAAVSHIDNYAPMECLTNAEYEAKQEAGTLEEDKLYYRFPNS